MLAQQPLRTRNSENKLVSTVAERPLDYVASFKLTASRDHPNANVTIRKILSPIGTTRAR